MARIFLHIGTHKTGTTSIQYYLNYRKNELLAQGILAPDAGKPANSKFNGNHRLAWAVDLRKWETSNESWIQLADEMDRTGHENIVLSSEAFCKIKDNNIVKVRQLLKDHEVFIIVYFRNYKEYIRSVYAQVIRDQKEIRSFPGYITSIADRINYDKILRNWGEHFGYDHLIVRAYDEVAEKGNLLSDFCHIIGFIPPDNDPHFQLQRNTSLDEKTIRALRLINLCKTKFPFLLKDQTFKNLKEAYYSQKKGYYWQKMIFKLLAKNRYYTKHAERLIADLAKNANQELLKEMIGEESMKYLER
jgi:hypothetical protein